MKFSRFDLFFLLSGLFLIIAGLLSAHLDSAPYGFGASTLYFAPLSMLTGYSLVALGILGRSMSIILKERLMQQFQSIAFWKSKYCFAFISFLLSFVVYLLTLEPTASFWDCGEFIASAYKLQIPHTPGNPLFLIIARCFAMLSFGDTTQVAWWINLMSGLFSAGAVGLCFLLIYDLTKKVSPSSPSWLSIAAALVGSQIMAYMDSFWFSAVEAEAYAIASFYTLLLFWLGWKSSLWSEKNQQIRWGLFLLFLCGLGYCIHPMCLLALPAIMVSFFQNGRLKWMLGAFGLGMILLFLINNLLVTLPFRIALHLDILMVNDWGLLEFSGVWLTLTAALIVGGLSFLKLKQAQLPILATFLLYIGLSPYLLLFIRSAHNPPIDSFSPDNLPAILAYMQRDQYVQVPLLYGHYFDARIQSYEKGEALYTWEDGRYLPIGHKTKYAYSSDRKTLLPRIYSSDPKHVKVYQQVCGLRPGEKPQFLDNLKFMFSYQLNFMYMRYLLWNFVGRDSDIKNAAVHWPWDAKKQNKANNQYFLFPLVLIGFGIFFLYRRDKKSFWVLASLFLMTGPILALYLNVTPDPPRERDYIYVVSYMVLAIYAGIGVIGLKGIIHSLPKTTLALILLVPGWMAIENWNDHDRSDRYIQMEQNRNILRSCAPNSILFTGGDNDTFPLWYLQQVEGVRTDVRVLVTSYLNASWNIQQLNYDFYESTAFDLRLEPKDYRKNGPNDVLPLIPSMKDSNAFSFEKYLRLIQEDHEAIRTETQNGEYYHYLPSDRIVLSTPKGRCEVKVTGNYLYKNELVMLDLMANSKRPLHFNFNAKHNINMDLDRHLVNEGFLLRFEPNTTTVYDVDAAYRNLIEESKYPNFDDPKIYLTHEDHILRQLHLLRAEFSELTDALIKKGDKSRAREVAQFSLNTFYAPYQEVNAQSIFFLKSLRILDMKDSYNLLSGRLLTFAQQQKDRQLKAFLVSNIEALNSNKLE
ncbi:glycosyltransferase family 117 protein [Reichenbachiella ulvae]|uniref:DUF2723 domain-containing protein n=1 Tax=Reichenbachiella ulvae TaxID=2980104 RepID=A0ABT3CVZ1_9BACT|nr:DUF2723 domain-containing protein [Reichenbachiella ulvae]MCV9387858.1 DUF2723 domain-containing protein [Reichenbachiella ulvae]